jgi:hypothetical protein
LFDVLLLMLCDPARSTKQRRAQQQLLLAQV